MPKTNAETMTVRLPTEIARDLMKLRDTKNLATVGSALKVWIDEEINRQRDTKLFELEELLNTLMTVVIKTNWKINVLAHPDELENREGEEVGLAEVLKAIDKISPKEIWAGMLEKPETKREKK